MYARAGYTASASYFHWIVAFPLIGTVATVLKAQQVPKEEKGEWMWRHKSLGLLTGMLVAPRVAYRLLSRDSYHVEKLMGSSSTEHGLAQVTHYMLYGFMIVMPASGVAMGYYGGKGLPFFGTTIPGALAADDETKKRNGQIAKQVRFFLLSSVIKR
jgi:1,2-dihydroxy-3-keto-5-methylthiopentene dioxygenase